MKIEWKCPRCGAGPDSHRGAKGPCQHRRGECSGFLCECDEESETHGESIATPCLNAFCGHCEWSGKFPKPPKGLAPWEKKALAAGWEPPAERAAELATPATQKEPA